MDLCLLSLHFHTVNKKQFTSPGNIQHKINYSWIFCKSVLKPSTHTQFGNLKYKIRIHSSVMERNFPEIFNSQPLHNWNFGSHKSTYPIFNLSKKWGKLRFFGCFFVEWKSIEFSWRYWWNKVFQIVKLLLKFSFLWLPTTSALSHCAVRERFAAVKQSLVYSDKNFKFQLPTEWWLSTTIWNQQYS